MEQVHSHLRTRSSLLTPYGGTHAHACSEGQQGRAAERFQCLQDCWGLNPSSDTNGKTSNGCLHLSVPQVPHL